MLPAKRIDKVLHHLKVMELYVLLFDSGAAAQRAAALTAGL